MQNQLNVKNHTIYTLDLNFQGIEGAIACYLIPHKTGVVLVECGPGSTIPILQAHLNSYGFDVTDISDVLLTHIHLDHAGASGWLAERGARIHVHPVGAPHLVNPQKLLSSAGRIYGDKMDLLWGEFLPVPESQLIIHQDREMIELGDLLIRPLDTPGHASHHFAYLLDGACFSGDIGGVRMSGVRHIRLPMPPPEFRLEKWRSSLEKLRQEHISHLLPTHFGIFSDPQWHLSALGKALDEVDLWMKEVMPRGLPPDDFRSAYLNWENQRAQADSLDTHLQLIYQTANPPEISILGIQRYWHKYRQGE
jgi:glyoxylase-like metal-dependent hydrolase (beta-lactamase superfamily II)